MKLNGLSSYPNLKGGEIKVTNHDHKDIGETVARLRRIEGLDRLSSIEEKRLERALKIHDCCSQCQKHEQQLADFFREREIEKLV